MKLFRGQIFFDALRAFHARQPLAGVAVSLVVGIYLGYRFPDALVLLLVLAVGGAALSRVSGDWKRPCALFFGVCLTGILLSFVNLLHRDSECAALLTLPSGEKFTCRVDPDIRIRNLKGMAARYTFSAAELESESGVRIRRLPVRINWYGIRPEKDKDAAAPHGNERWRFTGTFRPVTDRFGLIYVECNVSERASERIAAIDLTTWRGRVEAARRQAARRVAIGIEDWPVVPDLARAILLGARREIPSGVRQMFADSGTVHIFAISGMHIALIAGILGFAVSLLRIPRPYWFFALAPLIVFYTVVTGARPSAVRACLMTLFFFLGPSVGRRPNALASLAATAILVFVFQPWLVFDIGCRLSFAVMLGLVVFYKPFREIALRLFRVETLEERIPVLRAAGNTRLAWWCGVGCSILRNECGVFAVSLAAWLASIPLTAMYFGRFTPVSLLANLVIAPVSFLVVLSGCLGLLAGRLSETIAACFNNAAGFFIEILVEVSRISVSIPGGSFQIRKWNTPMVYAWLFLLILLAAYLRYRNRNRVIARFDR
ncbi:MAG: ComEC/Rec2 family competence protein [Kiritimatiellae bacterium]|nr:ComEC/Rec2 family competence protein [Kiritimatiellia bacterium]